MDAFTLERLDASAVLLVLKGFWIVLVLNPGCKAEETSSDAKTGWQKWWHLHM